MIKSCLKLALLTVFLVPVFTSKADEVDEALAALDDVIEELRAYEADLHENYYPMIKGHLDYTANRYYSFQTFDYYAVVKGLLVSAEQDKQRFEALKLQLGLIQQEINSDPSAVELARPRLFFLRVELANLIRRQQIYQSDIRTLHEGWKQRCKGERFEEEVAFFEPRNQFNPDSRLSTMVSPAGNFTIGIGLTMGTDGSVSGINPQLGHYQSQEWHAADTVALALSTYCGWWMPACLAAYYVVKLAVLYDEREDQMSDKEKEQWRLVKAIRNYQQGRIDQLSTEAPVMMSEICETSVAEEPKWSADSFKELEDNLSRSRDDLSLYIEEDLAIKQQELTDFIENVYIPETKQNYLTNLETYFADKAAINAEAREEFNQITEGFVAKRPNKGAVSKALHKHAVWNKVMVNDAKFLPEDHNSSASAELSGDNLFNRWQIYGNTLLKEVQ
ncbi:MAG: hypothetical protein HRT45_13345 [Bdellovibrionales bacterium]|nr:hypothetical protein [Bdellovibrionales bacterium]